MTWKKHDNGNPHWRSKTWSIPMLKVRIAELENKILDLQQDNKRLTMNNRFQCPSCKNNKIGEFIVNQKQGWVVCLKCATKIPITKTNQDYVNVVAVRRT